LVRIGLKLIYPEHLVKEPVLAQAVKATGLEPSIRRAEVEGDVGVLLIEVAGEPREVDALVEWLANRGVQVEVMGSEV
jgi:ABC-type methionine transport system ATPase subunit